MNADVLSNLIYNHVKTEENYVIASDSGGGESQRESEKIPEEIRNNFRGSQEESLRNSGEDLGGVPKEPRGYLEGFQREYGRFRD